MSARLRFPDENLLGSRRGGLAVAVASGDALDPLLAEAVVLLRASSLDTGSYTPGGDWPNEGTAGSDGDALAFGEPDLVDDDGLGFAIGPADTADDYLYIPDDPALAVDDGAFTAFARVKWDRSVLGEPGFGNIFAKITSDPIIGAGGSGWQLATGSGLGSNTAAIVCSGGVVNGTDPTSVIGGGALADGEHLLVLRVDRVTDELELFIDGVSIGTASTAAVGDVDAAHEWIFGRGTEQVGRAYGLWTRALTDTEITVDLPAALGV